MLDLTMRSLRDEANEDEWDVIVDVAIRAGILWRCPGCCGAYEVHGTAPPKQCTACGHANA